MPNIREDFSPALALEVKELLSKFSPGDKPLTSREAADLTGLSHATVAKMLRGLPVGRSATRQLAERLGGDIERILNLSGYTVTESEHFYSRPINEDDGSERLRPTPLVRLREGCSPYAFREMAERPKEFLDTYVEPWSRAVRVEGSVLEPEYRDGDILLIQERFRRLDGKLFLASLDGHYETGNFIRVGSRNYELEAGGMRMTALSRDYEFHGKIVGWLREE